MLRKRIMNDRGSPVLQQLLLATKHLNDLLLTHILVTPFEAYDLFSVCKGTSFLLDNFILGWKSPSPPSRIRGGR